MESISYWIQQCFDVYGSDESMEILIDGGISKNEFLMNHLSNLLGRSIKVMNLKDCTVQGTGLAAGLHKGFYKMDIV